MYLQVFSSAVLRFGTNVKQFGVHKLFRNFQNGPHASFYDREGVYFHNLNHFSPVG